MFILTELVKAAGASGSVMEGTRRDADTRAAEFVPVQDEGA